MKKRLIIELLEDVILSQQSATTGEHSSLPYLPGSVLLGVAAARLYAREDLDPFLLFHSGSVRFGNAYPVSVTGLGSMPMPFAYHYAKDREEAAVIRKGKSEARARNWLGATGTINLARANREHALLRDDQAKQMRSGFITPEFERLETDFRLQLKTAINPDTGRAANAQLFGYASIKSGQRFSAEIHLDPEAETYWPMLEAALTDDPLIGRSRSAEFGRVQITVGGAVEEDALEPAGEEWVLMALSDWCLVNTSGQPETRLSAALLGLSSGEIDWNRSFVRTRSYSPYNAKRRAYDSERQVIQQGSVLVLQSVNASEYPVLQKLRDQGLGLFREQGLGRVGVNLPGLLTEQPGVMAVPEESAISAVATKPIPAAQASQSPLVQWLRQRYPNREEQFSVPGEVEKLMQLLRQAYLGMRIYANLPAGEPCGPGKTQWGRIAELGKAVEVGQQGRDLFEELRNGQGDGILRNGDADWGRLFYDDKASHAGQAMVSLGDWLLARLVHYSQVENLSDRQLGGLCQQLARRAQEREIQDIREGL